MTAGAGIGLMLGVGLALVLWSVLERRPTLLQRVTPYLPSREPTEKYAASGWDAISAVRNVGETASRFVGGGATVQRRLDRLGWSISVADFRARQVVAGGCGLAVMFVVSLWIAAQGEPSPVALLVLCAVGFVGGVAAYDLILSRKLAAREARMAEQFPTIAELMALAVAAGETPAAALERVVDATHGELSHELQKVLGQLRTGKSFVAAIDDLARSTGVPIVARFAEALAIAIERGTPLTDVLHAQAADVRESARRNLIEQAARREAAMMVPVVFLVLPTTVIIAFYPGWIGLNLGMP